MGNLLLDTICLWCNASVIPTMSSYYNDLILMTVWECAFWLGLSLLRFSWNLFLRRLQKLKLHSPQGSFEPCTWFCSTFLMFYSFSFQYIPSTAHFGTVFVVSHLRFVVYLGWQSCLVLSLRVLFFSSKNVAIQLDSHWIVPGPILNPGSATGRSILFPMWEGVWNLKHQQWKMVLMFTLMLWNFGGWFKEYVT